MRIKTLFLLSLALLAAYMGRRALRRPESQLTAMLWLVLGQVAVSTTNSAKTRSTEARLNALVPKVFPNTGGTVNGSMTVTGNHTVNGALGVHAGGTVVGAQWTMDAGADVSGGLNTDTISASGGATVSGNMTVGGSHTVDGALGVHGGGTVVGAQWTMTAGADVSGGLGTDALSVGGHAIAPQSQPTGPGGPPTGGSGGVSSDGTSHYCGSFYSGSAAANWASNITTAVNAINIALANSGIFT